MTFYTKNMTTPPGGGGGGGESSEEFLSSTPYVHWGYLNSSQLVVKGKKIKKEKWTTLWLELCGSTLKLFKDSSLHVESASFPPPTTFIQSSNESKVAFLELHNAEVNIFSNQKFSEMSRKNVKKNSQQPTSVYRRHMFELKLKNTRSTFIFQASSRSSMLRWVAKIQESLDALNNPASDLATEGVNLAQQMIEVKSSAQRKYALDECDGFDDISIMSELPTTSAGGRTVWPPQLVMLKEKLMLLKELQWQIDTQIMDFYGRGKGEFRRDEFTCTTNRDYFLVPGRIETFIPRGTKVNVFGQLPNGRWRCVVETSDLLTTTRQLVKGLKSGDVTTRDERGDEIISQSRNVNTLMNNLNNEPDYPILGCLPTSILDFDAASDADVVPELAPRKSLKKSKLAYSVVVTTSPLDAISTIPAVESVDDTCCNSSHEKDELVVIGDLKITDLDDLSPYHSDSDDGGGGSDDGGSGGVGKKSVQFDKNVVENVKLRNFGEGIVIRNKLRQKGISIIVGDSSSEEEGEGEGN